MSPATKDGLCLKWLKGLQVPSGIELYHYTDKTGYEGIRSSGAFRIRQLTALDDKNEGSRGILALAELLDNYDISNRGANCLRTVLDGYKETYGFCKNPDKNSEQTLIAKDTGEPVFDRFYKYRIFELSLTDQARSAFHIEKYTKGDGYALEMDGASAAHLVVEYEARNPKPYRSIDRPFTQPQTITPPLRTIYGKDELQEQLDNAITAINKTIDKTESSTTLKLSPKGKGYPAYACCWNELDNPTVNYFDESLHLALIILACLYKSDDYEPESEVRILVVQPNPSSVSTYVTGTVDSSFDCVFLKYPDDFGHWHKWPSTKNHNTEEPTPC